MKSQSVGFVIDSERGYLGATPDGRVTLESGSRGIVEVKCPVTFKDLTVQESMGQSRYPLEYTSRVDGPVQLRVLPKLKRNHQYWHQVQLQLYCCRDSSTFCDFVLFHVNSSAMHVERITSDSTWIANNVPKFEQFYRARIVPFLLDREDDTTRRKLSVGKVEYLATPSHWSVEVR